MVLNRFEPTVEAPSTQQPICLLVLGMHRSGTSATARVLNLLGAKLPENLMGAAESNARGHWEPMSLVTIHDEMLQAAGSAWDDARALNLGNLSEETRGEFKAKILQVLDQEYGRSRIFLVKDPRICRFVPFWLDVLDSFGAQPRVVLPFRNPLEVARSLATRDRMSPAHAYSLWARHVLEAEHQTRNIPRAIFSFDDLLEDWRGVVERCALLLGLSLSNAPRAAEEIDAFLTAELRHHVSDFEEMRRDASVPPLVPDVFEGLVALSNGDEEAATPILDQARKSLPHSPDLTQAVPAEAHAEVHSRNFEVSELSETIARLSEEVRQRDERIAALERDLSALQASSSWRLTAPLRVMSRRVPRSARALRRAAKLAYWAGALQLPARLRICSARKRDLQEIRNSAYFDADWYRRTYRDLPPDIDPAEHYLLFGTRDGRNPGPRFDSAAYLAHHPDVAASGSNPLLHYIRHGLSGGR